MLHKLADQNHLVKQFVSDLYKLAESNLQLKRVGVIKHLKKCFCYAIAQNKGNTAALAAGIKGIPKHVYNNHENCGEWYTRNDNSSQTIKLTVESLYMNLKPIFFKYAQNACKFSVAVSSQAVNNFICSKAPKTKWYSKTESAHYRDAIAVLSKNKGDRRLINVKNSLGFWNATHSGNYCTKCVKLTKV